MCKVNSLSCFFVGIVQGKSIWSMAVSDDGTIIVS